MSEFCLFITANNFKVLHHISEELLLLKWLRYHIKHNFIDAIKSRHILFAIEWIKKKIFCHVGLISIKLTKKKQMWHSKVYNYIQTKIQGRKRILLCICMKPQLAMNTHTIKLFVKLYPNTQNQTKLLNIEMLSHWHQHSNKAI